MKALKIIISLSLLICFSKSHSEEKPHDTRFSVQSSDDLMQVLLPVLIAILRIFILASTKLLEDLGGYTNPDTNSTTVSSTIFSTSSSTTESTTYHSPGTDSTSSETETTIPTSTFICEESFYGYDCSYSTSTSTPTETPTYPPSCSEEDQLNKIQPDCYTYYICRDGLKIYQTCPPGEAYNCYLGICDTSMVCCNFTTTSSTPTDTTSGTTTSDINTTSSDTHTTTSGTDSTSSDTNTTSETTSSSSSTDTTTFSTDSTSSDTDTTTSNTDTTPSETTASETNPPTTLVHLPCNPKNRNHYSNPLNCNSFYICVKDGRRSGHLELQYCPTGQKFDINQGRCTSINNKNVFCGKIGDRCKSSVNVISPDPTDLSQTHCFICTKGKIKSILCPKGVHI